MIKKSVILGCILSLFELSTGFSFQSEIKKETESNSSVKKDHVIHVSDRLNSEEFQKPFFEQLKKSGRTHTLNKVTSDPLNTIRNFWVYNFNTDAMEARQFKLVRKGTVSQLWFETADIYLTEAVADSMFAYLETKSNSSSYNPSKGIIKLDNEIFGNPPNYDGDGLVDFLVCDIRDSYDPETNSGYTGGFFITTDQNPDPGSGDYRSNQRDILYMDSYPGIHNNSPGTADPQKPLSTLAHEYQHLIHYNYNGRIGQNEYTFINEGQSNFASLASGYLPYDGAEYLYLNNSNVPIFRWDRGDNGPYDDYARSAVFCSYMWDQLGFAKAKFLTQSSLSGVSGINDALTKSGSALTFPSLLTNWGIANYISDVSVNSQYGYSNPVIKNWKAASSVKITNPIVSTTTVNVYRGGIYYLTYLGVKNLNITITSPGGIIKAFKKKNGSFTVDNVTSGSAYTTPSEEIYDEVTFMFVNPTPSANETVETTTLGFTYSSTGASAINNVKSYGASKYYWAVPYYNANNVGRFGFSQKYTINSKGILKSLKLYTTTGTDGSTGEPIEVKGTGKLRFAIYADNAGSPGALIKADTLDFSDILPNWNEIDVTSWNYKIVPNVPFHVAYSCIVSTVNTDINSIPLRLDDGTGTQGITKIYTGAGFAANPFKETNGNENNVWNEIDYFITTSISDEIINEKADSYSLSQNYPNPFNPSTQIEFSLPKAENASLIVYNTLGQKVAILLNQNLSSGTHKLTWNGRDDHGNQVTSGVYFYQLVSGNFSQTKQMILVK